MASVSLTLPPNYWQTFSPNHKDLEFIATYLFEKEMPLNEAELVPVLVGERIRTERQALIKKQESVGKIYLPKEHYKNGAKLVFPALDWKNGKVTSMRPGVNPTVDPFEVIEVEFEGGATRQFAASL
jgi:hypothetical protein